MKRVIVAVLMVAILTLGLLVGCGGTVTGSGNPDTQEFNFSDFTRVDVQHAFELEVTQSDSYSVIITADDNLFDYIQVSKSGETLKIKLEWGYNYPSYTAIAKITMPNLRGLSLSGASQAIVEDFSSSQSFSADLSGASTLDMSNMSAGDIKLNLSGASRVKGNFTASGGADFDLSGASTVELDGSANDMLVEASGASRLKLGDFQVNNADVNLSGASTGTVNLDGRLDANLSGASKLTYIGEPTMGTINTSGGSTLSKK